MQPFSVTVKTADHRYAFFALGHTSGEIHCHVLDRFGGLCSVVVKPLKGGKGCH